MGLENDQQIIGRGESTEYHISVSNNGLNDDIIDFMVVDIPEKWKAELNHYSLNFGFGELKQIVLTVTAPDDVRHNEWANITVYGISRADDTVSDMVIARTQMVIKKGVKIASQNNISSIMPLSTITLNINITNRGSFEDEFYISISEIAKGWKIKAKPQFIYLLEFETSSFNITVTHGNLSSIEEINFKVTAISEYDSRINTTLSFTVYTNLSYKVEMKILNSNIHKVRPGDSTNYAFMITNLCEFSIDVNLSFYNKESVWEVYLSENSLHLNEYGSMTFNLTVRPPQYSLDGDKLNTIITATIYLKTFLQYSNYTTTIVSYENKLSVDETNLHCYGYPNNYTQVNFTVTNIGTSDYISHKLLELPVDWNLDFSPSEEFLNTNESRIINAHIFINQDAENEDYKIVFELVSGEFSILMNIIVHVNQTFGIMIDPANVVIDIMPGRNTTLPFTVTNTGNGRDIIFMNPINNYSDWLKVDNESVELFNSESTDNIARISIPSDIIPDSYILELMANSSGNHDTVELLKIICRISKPDLYLSVPPVEESMRVQHEYAFRVTVYNHGNINISEDIKITLSVDDELISEYVINGISANSNKLIILRWNAQSGSHMITFTVDPNEIIPEKNELNNSISYETKIIGDKQDTDTKTAILFSLSIVLIIIIICVGIVFVFYRRFNDQFDKKYRCSVLKPESDSLVNGKIDITGNVSDKSVHHIHLQLDEGNWNKVPIKDEEWTYNLDTNKFDNGQHSISVKIIKLKKETKPVKIKIHINNE